MQINSIAHVSSVPVNDGQSKTSKNNNSTDVGSAPTTVLAASLAAQQQIAGVGAGEKSAGAGGREPSGEERKAAVEMLNQIVKSNNESLQFSIDDDTDIRLVKLIDISTKETIRQFPSEEIVDIARAMKKLQGMMVVDKA